MADHQTTSKREKFDDTFALEKKIDIVQDMLNDAKTATKKMAGKYDDETLQRAYMKIQDAISALFDADMMIGHVRATEFRANRSEICDH